MIKCRGAKLWLSEVFCVDVNNDWNLELQSEDAEDIINDIRWEHGKWSEREASNIVRL